MKFRSEFKTGKEYFSNLGFDHTSLDINGLDGALTVNLSNKIKDDSLLNQFDILTNIGTSEHIEDQYWCFWNIHNLLRINGIFIHIVPKVKTWKKHGIYKYDFQFFYNLAKANKYKILKKQELEKARDKILLCISMKKTQNNKFIDKNTFNKIFMGEKNE